MVCLSSRLFSCDCFCPLVRHGTRRPHPVAESIINVTAALQYNWSPIRYTWTLQPHPIHRAFSRALFEFSHLIFSSAFIGSSECTKTLQMSKLSKGQRQEDNGFLKALETQFPFSGNYGIEGLLITVQKTPGKRGRREISLGFNSSG